MTAETFLNGRVTIYHGDCLEILPTIEAVDHVITDPPYEQLMQDLHRDVKLRRVDGGNERKMLEFQGIDKIRQPFLKEVKRINGGWLLAFCNVEGVWHWRVAIIENGLKFKITCLWNKPDSTPKLNGQGPALSYECFTTTWCGRGHARWNGGGRRGVFTHCTNSKDRHGEHPTEKPISLMSELVSLFSDADQKICDPFMGSGTTGVAAVTRGLSFVGIERESAYFETALARISEALARPSLLVEMPKPAKQEAML